MAGQASLAQPCSVMSGHTPVAMSWSTARITSTVTPCFSMIDRLRSISPPVWVSWGERLSVQLTNNARRSSYRIPVTEHLLVVCPHSARRGPKCYVCHDHVRGPLGEPRPGGAYTGATPGAYGVTHPQWA